MYLFIFSYCCSMFAIIHRSMAWIYNCKCVHLDERKSRWKFFEESNESHNHSIFNSLQMTFKSNNALHIIEKIHVWTWKPKWLYTWTNNRTPSSSIHVCFAGSGNSHDFFSRWTSCHEQNTWYIHTMRKEKNEIQETFENWIHQNILLQLLYY